MKNTGADLTNVVRSYVLFHVTMACTCLLLNSCHWVNDDVVANLLLSKLVQLLWCDVSAEVELETGSVIVGTIRQEHHSGLGLHERLDFLNKFINIVNIRAGGASLISLMIHSIMTLCRIVCLISLLPFQKSANVELFQIAGLLGVEI